MTQIKAIAILGMICLCASPGCSNSNLKRLPADDQSGLPREDAVFHLISTTDLHGYLQAQPNEKQILTGGVDYMSGYFNAARALDPETLILDSGDLFQGTLLSNSTEGQPVVRFYKYAGYTATAIGNHDFDYGPSGPDTIVRQPGEDPLGALKDRIAQAKAGKNPKSQFLFLSANICDVNEDPGKCEDATNYKVASFTRPYVIKTVHGINVGIIGLTTSETPKTTMPQNVANLRFMPMDKALEQYIPLLQLQGANAIVVIAHSGGFCDSKTKLCNKDGQDEIFNTIDNLPEYPKNTIAAVLAGHTHTWLNTVYKGVHVIISGRYGQSFGYLTLKYHAIDGTTTVESSENYDFCQKTFSSYAKPTDTPNCHFGKGPLAPPTFLGHAVTPDPAALDLISADIAATDAETKTIVGHAKSPLLKQKDGPESTMGDYMADSMRLCYLGSDCKTHADFSFQNNGGIRSEIPVGPVSFGQVFQGMPFDNYMATLKLTGAQVLDLITIWYNYQHNQMYQVSGMQITYDPASTAKRNITNQAGKTKSFTDPLIQTQPPLDPLKVYTVVLPDFLASGGGGSDFIVSSLKPAPYIDYNRKCRDTMVDYLKSLESAGGLDLSAQAPRLIPQSQ